MTPPSDGGPKVGEVPTPPTPISYGPIWLSLRDYFAAAALTGLNANTDLELGHDDMAAMAYRDADAMLRAREASDE